jgi:Ca2+-binding EF-hand superfamily protein
MLDMNGDGSVDSYEFCCAMALLAHGTLEEKAELVFGIYDTNKSGVLEKHELEVLMTNTTMALNAIDGKHVSPMPEADKVKFVATVKSKTDSVMKAMDRDGD